MQSKNGIRVFASMALALSAGTFTACDKQEDARVYEGQKTVQVAGLPPVSLQIAGPRQLTEAEAAKVAPSVRVMNADDRVATAAPAPLKTSGAPDESSFVDLSDFIITTKVGGDVAPAASAANGVGQLNQALSGTVVPAMYTYVGSVAQGSSVTYQVTAPISVGLVMPSSGDADLFLENCGGGVMASSTASGLTTDYGDIYNANGLSTCRQFRVYGYRASSFKLVVYNYR